MNIHNWFYVYIYRYVQLYMCGKLRVSHNVSVYICSVHIQRASFELRLPYLGLQPPLVHHLFPTLMAIGSKSTDYSPFLLVKSPYIATDGVSARWNNVFEKKKGPPGTSNCCLAAISRARYPGCPSNKFRSTWTNHQICWSFSLDILGPCGFFLCEFTGKIESEGWFFARNPQMAPWVPASEDFWVPSNSSNSDWLENED